MSRPPGTTLTAPAGKPASVRISARRRAGAGTCGAGLTTTQFPAARAGATLWATRFSGALNGVIAATVPTGHRVITAMTPAPPGMASGGGLGRGRASAAEAAARSVHGTREASAGYA